MVSRKRVVTLRIEVPTYSARDALKNADSMTRLIEDLLPVKRTHANGNAYIVKGISVS